ncbi:MAG: glutaminase A [Rikenellaceae bacterium]
MENSYKEEIKLHVKKAYDAIKHDKGGRNADYIPYLANVSDKLFSIAITFADGEVYEVGDSDYIFGIESISKVSTAILAMQQCGANEVLEKIGSDATGLPFNSVMAILLESDHPSTPLVNSGAIAACSMVKPTGDSDKKWHEILYFMEKLCADKLEVIEQLYKSESDTNFNNHAIAWLLKNYDRIYDNPDLALDLYTRQCSVGISTHALSVMAATIANKGVNPVTKAHVFDAPLAPKIISMISTVGFYEHTGDWLFESGIPAKTGVGGGIMGVMPGKFGIAAFAPPIDEAGNSVKAQKAIKMICNELEINVFN